MGSAGSADLAKLLGLARHYANADLASFTDANVIALLNRSLHEMQVWVLEAYDIFEFSGTIAKSNLVAGTNSYSFPTDFVQISRIELNYSGNQNDWSRARIKDLRNINDGLANLEDTDDQQSSAQNPIVYLFNNKLYLKYPPSNNVTNGLWVYYTPIQTELTSTSTDEPSLIPEHFHETLCEMAALKWLGPRDAAHVTWLQGQIDRGHQELTTYFKKTLNTDHDRIVPKKMKCN